MLNWLRRLRGRRSFTLLRICMLGIMASIMLVVVLTMVVMVMLPMMVLTMMLLVVLPCFRDIAFLGVVDCQSSHTCNNRCSHEEPPHGRQRNPMDCNETE